MKQTNLHIFVVPEREDRKEEIEKLFRMTKFNSDEAIIRFAKKLTKMGIDQKLEEMGAKSGDKIKILDFEFEYRA